MLLHCGDRLHLGLFDIWGGAMSNYVGYIIYNGVVHREDSDGRIRSASIPTGAFFESFVGPPGLSDEQVLSIPSHPEIVKRREQQ
jgi:hypothetical protein